GHLVEPVELDLDVAQTLHHVAANGLLLVQRRLLLQDADGGTGGQEGVTIVRLVQTGHDPQDARLAGPVGAYDTDLGARIEAQRDVVQDHLVAVRLADLLHRVDELSHSAVMPFWSSRFISRTILCTAGGGPVARDSPTSGRRCPPAGERR